jgi:nucleoside-diphosphate-sugar epimerase
MNKIIAEDLDFILKSNVDWEKLKDRTILITGAYGMLLSYATYTLLRLNEIEPKFNVTVIALIRDKEKAKRRLGRFVASKYLKLFEHDLVSPIKISENIDYIIHGASYASPHYFETNPVAVLIPNVIGTYHLLELARSNKVKGFLFFSSGAVYGKAAEVVTEKDYGYLDPLDIKSCYGESKRMAENMSRCWSAQFGIPVKIVRPAHIYGPTMNIENDSRVFANFVNCVIKGRDIVMESDGFACRSFCYIADATVAFFKVLLDGADGEAYNVGNDAAYIPIKKLAEVFVSTLPEKQLKVVVKKKDDIQSGGKMLMSSKKMESLGWKCEFAIQEGLKRTIESFLPD